MTFANPELFWLFLLLLPAAYLFWRRGKKEGVNFSVHRYFRKPKKNFGRGKWLTRFRSLVTLIVFSLFVVALARPQNVTQNESIKQEGIDIFLAIDVSESMLAEDLKPNRLEAAKKVIAEFLDQVKGDRIGIIVFSGKPFTQSPLTFDTEIIREYLATISTDSIRQSIRVLSGTAIGDALLSAVNKFKKSEDRSKVLILLTDGEANTGVDPIVAAQYAGEEKVKIYTIGVGQEGGAPLPYFDQFGNKQVARDRFGRVIMSTFDEKTLQEIASIGNGQYFHAGDNEALREIFDQIGKLEKKEIETTVVTVHNETFMPFLYTLLAFYLLLLLIRSRQVPFP